MLDLVLTNKEGLVENVKLKGSLGCSDNEMEELEILGISSWVSLCISWVCAGGGSIASLEYDTAYQAGGSQEPETDANSYRCETCPIGGGSSMVTDVLSQVGVHGGPAGAEDDPAMSLAEASTIHVDLVSVSPHKKGNELYKLQLRSVKLLAATLVL
ncbi:hypothetical protein WISP_39421 [Willisornis vidua]|uniref:Uncharacterized protein n=1 Tax=Willisornis vidua TaxID=1566151 RepID=A0ABQ9DHD8_9PASS|nr:hypothetical protein WISP_39421 [Willisornis vidua]